MGGKEYIMELRRCLINMWHVMPFGVRHLCEINQCVLLSRKFGANARAPTF